MGRKVEGSGTAVIFVPGIGVSGLFNTSPKSLKYAKNTNIWLYGDEFPMGNFWSSNESKKSILENNYNDFFCNQFGVPVNCDIKPLFNVEEGMSTKDAKMVLYGYNNMFEQIIKKVKIFVSLYSEKTIDVFMFNYDWRLDLEKGAMLLKEVIEKYSDVVIVGYSLGGLVSVHALQELEKDGTLSKVKGFIACAVPFLGSYSACTALMYGYGVADTLYVPKDVQKKLNDVCRNFSSLYNLLPYSFFSREFINGEKNLAKVIEYDFNVRLFANSLVSYYKRSMFRWYDKVPNIYVVSGRGYKVLDVVDSKMFLNGDFSNYTDGDGTVACKSSNPSFLNGKTKGFFEVKVYHGDVMTNVLVMQKVMHYIGNILNVKKDSTDIRMFNEILKQNDFSQLGFLYN